MKNRNQFIVLLVISIVLVVAVILFFQSNMASQTNQPTVTGTPTSIWKALQESTPVAFFTPLPSSAQTVIDGIYTKIDDSWPQWWRCMRCGDYRMAGGIWKIQFDQGVMRIFYDVTG